MTTTEQLAWAAGFIDGEGYIGIQRKLDRNRWRKEPTEVRGIAAPFIRLATYKLKVSVSQRNREALEFIQDLFGGTIRQTYTTTQPGTVYHSLELSSLKALRLLEGIYPYLINKRAVAAVAIEFGRWYDNTKNRPGSGHPMSDERRQRASDYCDAVQKINRTYRNVPEQTVRPKLVHGATA
jgi:hypothetical protein